MHADDETSLLLEKEYPRIFKIDTNMSTRNEWPQYDWQGAYNF